MTKQKFIEIVVTAGIGFLLAVLNNVLALYLQNTGQIIAPTGVGAISAILWTFKQSKYV